MSLKMAVMKKLKHSQWRFFNRIYERGFITDRKEIVRQHRIPNGVTDPKKQSKTISNILN